MSLWFHTYQSLSSSDKEEGEDTPNTQGNKKHGGGWLFLLVICAVSIGVNFYILGLWVQCRKYGCSLYPQLTPTPIESALRYKTMVFERGLVDQASIYENDPSPQVDHAWIQLYEFSGSTLPGQEHVPSFNETLEFVKRKGNRIRMLDVFHQIHCLDTIRRALYPSHYRHHADSGHVMHCINSIRQSLMCMADVSVASWEWDEELKALIESAENMHTCRDFERIKEWARGNHFDRQFVGTS